MKKLIVIFVLILFTIKVIDLTSTTYNYNPQTKPNIEKLTSSKRESINVMEGSIVVKCIPMKKQSIFYVIVGV